MSEATTELTCSCDEVFSVTYENDLDLSSATIRNDILEGRYLSFPCPACNRILKIEPLLQMHDGNDLWEVFPESERDHFLLGNLKIDPRVHRVVFGYKEMAEKVHLLEERLDDRPIEILKYLFLQKQGWPENLVLSFKNADENKIFFYLEGLKANEIGITGIPRIYYEKLWDQISHPLEEYSELLTPPYISVQKLAKQD